MYIYICVCVCVYAHAHLLVHGHMQVRMCSIKGDGIVLICINVHVYWVNVITIFVGLILGVGKMNTMVIKGMVFYDEYAHIARSAHVLRQLPTRIIRLICLGKHVIFEYRHDHKCSSNLIANIIVIDMFSRSSCCRFVVVVVVVVVVVLVVTTILIHVILIVVIYY